VYGRCAVAGGAGSCRSTECRRITGLADDDQWPAVSSSVAHQVAGHQGPRGPAPPAIAEALHPTIPLESMPVERLRRRSAPAGRRAPRRCHLCRMPREYPPPLRRAAGFQAGQRDAPHRPAGLEGPWELSEPHQWLRALRPAAARRVQPARRESRFSVGGIAALRLCGSPPSGGVQPTTTRNVVACLFRCAP